MFVNKISQNSQQINFIFGASLLSDSRRKFEKNPPGARVVAGVPKFGLSDKR